MKTEINVLVNGILHKGAFEIAKAINAAADMTLLPNSVTDETDKEFVVVNDLRITLWRQKQRLRSITGEESVYPNVIFEYLPSEIAHAVNFCCLSRKPFVLVTNGIKINDLLDKVMSTDSFVLVSTPEEMTKENALKAIRFLHQKQLDRISTGELFSMEDVLKG